MENAEFWTQISEILASHKKYHGAQEAWEALVAAEASAFAAHREEIHTILDGWTAKLTETGFAVEQYSINAQGVELLYQRRGYCGVAGFRSVTDAAGNFVASWIPRGSDGRQTRTHPDPDQAAHLGQRFSADRLRSFLEENLLTFVDDSNLYLPAEAYAEWQVDYLQQFHSRFRELESMSDRQAAGRELEDLLDRLFTMARLSPRRAFRVTGEEIDGSFELNGHTYLVEAKWHKHPLGAEPLNHFCAKIAGKNAYTRGVLIAINGVTQQAIDAVSTGKERRFFVLTGREIERVLCGKQDLVDLLNARQRRFDEEGVVLPKEETQAPSG